MTALPRPVYLSIAVLFVLIAIGLAVAGKDLLVPLAVAIIIWYILNAFVAAIGRLRFGTRSMPNWLNMTLAVASVLAMILMLAEMISDSVSELQRAAPTYQANLEILIGNVSSVLGLERLPNTRQILEQINVGSVARSLAGAIASFMSNVGLILIYVLFLLVEQQSFDKKVHALFPDSEREARIRKLLGRINGGIRQYLWIKTLMSLLTGGACYVVLFLLGLDLAGFWAFMIFLLNYIPTVGSLLGIVFPALLGLLQFGAILPFATILVLLGAINMVVGNMLEPRLMGRSLNVSALVVILSLVFWGSIWGVAGMFLCVPITVIAMIVLSRFPSTRPVAILLSNNGKIATDD